MSVHRLLVRSVFGPEEIAVLANAYDDALRALDLVDRTDPATMRVARMVIEVAQTGVGDRAAISAEVIRGFRDQFTGLRSSILTSSDSGAAID
jgi:hypothetical protein